MRKRLKRLFSLPAIPSWIIIIWKVLERLDTMTFILEQSAPIWKFLSSPLGTWVVLLIGFGILIYIVVRPEKKHVIPGGISAPSMAETINKKQPETHPSWLTKIYESDKANLESLLMVQKVSVSCQSDPMAGGHITFAFDVFNASVMTVKVASVNGYILFQGNNFYDKPDPLTSRTIPHAVMNTVRIRQRILPEVAKTIDDGVHAIDGIVVSFDFRNVSILIEEDTSIGMGASCILNIAEVMEFRVKESSMRGHHFHQWERIGLTHND